MKIGFNEGCNRFCENHSVLEDLDLCEKYGFDYIDIQSECLDREIAAGKYTIDDLGAWFADPKHHLKMLSYNALIFFNMKQTQEEKDAVMAKLDQIIADCNKLGCKMIVVVPSMDLTVPATVDEIKADAVAVLKEMVKKVEPHGIKLSIEFCGAPTMSINRFEYAYDIVTEVDHPLVGITLDQYHFHAMASEWAALEKADGKKIFVWHLNGMENMPCGAAYNNDEKRLWPGEPGDCLDHKRYADTMAKQYFGDENPIGEQITYACSDGNLYNFTIVGIYEYNAALFGKVDTSVPEKDRSTTMFIPIQTCFKLMGKDQSGYTNFNLMVNSLADIDQATTDVTNFFEEKYANNKNFHVTTYNMASDMGMHLPSGSNSPYAS